MNEIEKLATSAVEIVFPGRMFSPHSSMKEIKNHLGWKYYIYENEKKNKKE
jgi:hypothetical protein